MEDPPLKTLKFLSQSTDSLHKTSKVTESTESLTDEGKSLHLVLESLLTLLEERPVLSPVKLLNIYSKVIHNKFVRQVQR